MNIHERSLNLFMNQIVNEYELFMNVPEQQMSHSWYSWTVNLVHERPYTKIIHEPDSQWTIKNGY